jgi:hypothetical protein
MYRVKGLPTSLHRFARYLATAGGQQGIGGEAAGIEDTYAGGVGGGDAADATGIQRHSRDGTQLPRQELHMAGRVVNEHPAAFHVSSVTYITYVSSHAASRLIEPMASEHLLNVWPSAHLRRTG